MVNAKCIEVFLSIVEHKSISSVARSSYLSQPTVSEYLNQLETLVGTALVLRGKGCQRPNQFRIGSEVQLTKQKMIGSFRSFFIARKIKRTASTTVLYGAP